MRYLLTLLLLPLAVLAKPKPANSTCPSNVGRQALTKRFFESVFEQPDRNHTEDALNFYAPNIHVTDTTADYPSPIRGISYPVRGTYAKNRAVFLQEVKYHFAWPYYGVINSPVDLALTNAVGNLYAPCYIDGGMEVTGYLLRNWGGHKKGDNVTVEVTARLDLSNETETEDQKITKVVYSIDWSQWYATLPPK